MGVESAFESLILSDFSLDFAIFALIFSLFYFGLTASGVLGEKKNYNLVIALVTSLMVSIPGFLGVETFSVFVMIKEFLPNFAVILIFVVMLVMFAGLIGKDARQKAEIFSVLFIVTLNVLAYYLIPELFDFFLTSIILVSILNKILTKKTGWTGYILTSVITIVFFFLGDAIFTEGIIEILEFMRNPLLQTTLIGILLFLIVINFILKKDET